MKQQLIELMMEGLFAVLSPDLIKKGLDALLDVVEDAVTGSENTYDDAIVLPMCKLFRNALNIPDND